MFLEGVLVAEFSLEASSDFGKSLFNLFHLVLGHSLLVQDGVVVSLENVFGAFITLDGSHSTGNTLLRRRGSLHNTLVSLSQIVEAAEVSSQVLIAHFTCVLVLELYNIVNQTFLGLLLSLG